MNTQGLPQLSNQRWFHWQNNYSERCPPYGCIGVYGTEVDKGRLVLWGTVPAERIYRDPIIVNGSSYFIGIGWNMCFNSGQSVAPGEIGLCTFDLPAWCFMAPVSGYGSIYDGSNFQNGSVSTADVISPYVVRGWGLVDVRGQGLIGDSVHLSELAPGLQLITACSIGALNESLIPSDLGNQEFRRFYVGLVGGMTHYFRGRGFETGEEEAQ